MSHTEFKQKGNAAFGKGDYSVAIKYYSKAIDAQPENDTYYSNRSAAYLKKGDFEAALKDASKCISLNRKNHKGYGRKGAAYHAMKRYDKAISTYKEGLKVCPDEEHLLKGLAAAKRANVENTKASRAVRRAEVTKKATKSKGGRAKRSDNVSTFVKQTRQELKLQMAAIQSQLDLINELAAMKEDEKLDLLFTLIDRDGDGTVDAKELAAAMRKRNDELSFTDSIENAIDMVATFDTDGDAKLDHDEFKHYVDVMLKELGVTFTEFSEFLVIQILFADDKESEEELQLARDDINKEVKAREVLFDMLSDERMVELFQLFDKDGTGELTFKEVAIGLYQMTQNVEESTRTAMNLLLMMDKNDKRTLSYEQFGRLIMAIVAAGNTTFDEIADDLTLAVTSNDTICEEDLETLIVAETIFQKSKDLEEGSRRGEVDALSYGRLKRLFSLWDIDGDGDITLTELTEGLRMFQAAAGIEGDAEREAQALLGFDSDGDQRLDPREFSHAMVHYAKEFGIDLHELIDFMCVTSVMGEKNTQGFQEAYGKALTSDDYGKKVKPNNEQYYVGEGDVDFYD